MGKPALPLGTSGAVRYYRTEFGYRARTLHRDLDGTTRHVERSGKSKAAADAALKAALRDRMRVGVAEELTPETAVKVAAVQWFAGLTRPYRPATDGKVERFHRTLLEEWAYAHPYANNSEREAAYPDWLLRYNHHRGHTALGGRSPASRVTNLTGQYN